MEDKLSWNTQTQLKQNLLEASEVPHALSACRNTSDCCLNLVEKLIDTDGTQHGRLVRQDLFSSNFYPQHVETKHPKPNSSSPQLCDYVTCDYQDYREGWLT